MTDLERLGLALVGFAVAVVASGVLLGLIGAGSGGSGTERYCSRQARQAWTLRRPGTSASASLKHLISPQQQRRRDREAEGSRGLEVDDQFELGRLLDGEVGRLCAFQNLIDVRGRPAK